MTESKNAVNPDSEMPPVPPSDLEGDTEEIGVVRWYSLAKGYGFIVRESTGEDVFVHYSELTGQDTGTLVEGDRVRFTVADGPKGLRGRQVVRLP